MESIDGSSLGLRNDVDGGFGGRETRSLLAGLLGLVLGEITPDGGNGNDELEGGGGDNGFTELLAENVHKMVTKSRDIIRDELFSVAATTSSL